jgi:hypothetical protein
VTRFRTTDTQEAAAMPDVRIGGRWRLWPGFALRGAGFPAHGVLDLAPDGLAGAAAKLARDLDHKISASTAGEPPGSAALTGPDWTAFTAQYETAAVETAVRLQRIARQPAFQAALAWQNRPVLDSAVTPFLAWTPEKARTSHHRGREVLIAQYWQRFCVKNDTIGFFGPVGWGHWDPAADGVTVDPGQGLVRATNLYFSSWAVDTVAKTLADELRPWVAPRRVPFVRLAVGALTVPGRPPVPATPDQLSVLTRCDGVRTARDLQAALPGVDVPAVLADLVARRWLVWRLEVPASTWPERELRAVVDRVDDPDTRRRGLDRLAVLDRARDRIAAAGDDVAALTGAMSALEQDFTALTDTDAVRDKGRSTAPCRAVLYSDCVRSATATVGADVLAALAPLDLLLTSAHWLTGTLAQQVLAKAREVHRTLAADGPVDLATFWFACLPVLHGDGATLVADLLAEFQRRWTAILTPPDGAARVHRAADAIRERVLAAFGDAPPGWTAARYCSPDVLIAAESTEAIARDEFELVLGELHLAANTTSFSLFVHQHPDPEQLFAELDRDHPGPRLLPMLAKEHKARLSTRIRQTLVRPEDYYVGLVDHTIDPARPRTVLSADVTVREQDGDLVVELPDGAVFPVLDVFAHVLTTMSMDLFRPLPEEGHTPRVTLDRLVVTRETWRPPVADLTFARARTEAARYLLAQRWRAARELPRFVFVVSPAEPRPFYVDLDSPVYVEVLTRAARRLTRQDPAAHLTITEMHPTPTQSWLTDHTATPHTAELRLVTTDTLGEGLSGVGS